MIIGRSRFNIYLFCLFAVLFAGCKTAKDEKEKFISTLSLHIEVVPDSSTFSKSVTVSREKPVTVNIETSPFISEAQVAEAKVVDELGGWALQIKFQRRGSWLLEQYTTTNPGKHIAVFSIFGEDKKNKESRWLGAPIITRRISNGTLTFTPDATREEAETIARGLNNLARQVEEKAKW
jgi:preprotein translocase subunit SecD